MIYEFIISRPSLSSLQYEAREDQPTPGLAFRVRNPPLTTGAYPEVDQHLKATHGVTLSPGATFVPRLGDTFDSETGTWTYQRNNDQIVVHDVPRTVMETF